jgi:hypothetical protein
MAGLYSDSNLNLNAPGADILKQLSGGYVAGAAAGPKVYMGSTYNYADDVPAMDRKGHASDSTLTTDGGKQYFFSLSATEQQSWADKLYRAGIINDPSNYDAAFAQWSSAVDYAANQYTYGGKKITPWDVLQARMGLAKTAGPKTTTSNSTSVTYLAPGDAEAMVKAVYQNALGRDPSSGELSRYRSMLISRVKANPQHTKTTQTVDVNGNSTSSSVTSGGATSQSLQQGLMDKAQADPEYGAYQAATTYMGALQQLMSGGPNLVAGGRG